MTSIAPPASNPELPVVFGTGSALGSESRLQPHPFNPAESLATDETPMEHGLYHFTMIIVIKLGRARRSARAVRTRAQNRRARSDAPYHRGIDTDCLPRMVLGTENCFFRRAFILHLPIINLISQSGDFSVFSSVFILCFIRGQLP